MAYENRVPNNRGYGQQGGYNHGYGQNGGGQQRFQSAQSAEIKLMRLRVRMVYDAGRERDVKDFVEQAKLLEYLKGVGDSREEMIRFAHYMEALVAYHRYLGGRDN